MLIDSRPIPRRDSSLQFSLYSWESRSSVHASGLGQRRCLLKARGCRRAGQSAEPFLVGVFNGKAWRSTGFFSPSSSGQQPGRCDCDPTVEPVCVLVESETRIFAGYPLHVLVRLRCGDQPGVRRGGWVANGILLGIDRCEPHNDLSSASSRRQVASPAAASRLGVVRVVYPVTYRHF